MSCTLRPAPVVGWAFATLCFIFSLLTLLAGKDANELVNAAIFTFNTSSIGLPEFYNVSSPLHKKVHALVHINDTSPPSITEYLGIKDWYTIHLVHVCSGYFEKNVESSTLTSKKIDKNCEARSESYSFRLRDTVRNQLDPSVRDLVYGLPRIVVDTDNWAWLWYVGIGFCVMVWFLITVGFEDKSSWIWATLAFSIISLMFFTVSNGLTSYATLRIRTDIITAVPVPFWGLSWTTASCMFVTVAVCLVDGVNMSREISTDKTSRKEAQRPRKQGFRENWGDSARA